MSSELKVDNISEKTTDGGISITDAKLNLKHYTNLYYPINWKLVFFWYIYN